MKKHRVSELVLKEISAVRKPAHEGATIDLTKSADKLVLVRGYYESMTSACMCGTKTDSKYCPDCGTMMKAAVTPPVKETTMSMTDQEKAALEKAQNDAKTLEAKLAVSQKFGLLNDVQKSHYGRLGPDAQAAFLGLSDAQRAEECKAIYTSAGGQVFTKADDTRLVEMAKAHDETAKKMHEQLDAANETILKSQAAIDYQYLPGTVDAKVALLKSVLSIKDDKVRGEAVAILKAQNDALGKGFKRQGTGAVPAGGVDATAEGKLDALVKTYMTEKKCDEASAYDAVLQTEQGAALYKALES